MGEAITFNSYNDSVQARHTKAWVNQQATQQKDNLKIHSVSETPKVPTETKNKMNNPLLTYGPGK